MIRSTPRRGIDPFTPAQHAMSRIGGKATAEATARLRKAHAQEYAAILTEERAKLGLPPVIPKMSMSEMKRLACLAIEAGLDQNGSQGGAA